MQDALRVLVDLVGFVGFVGFVGAVESAGVRDRAVDVAVTDGFTGNIMLKTIEACGPRPGEVSSRDTAALALGVRGTVLVAHDAATGLQLADAARMASRIATGSGRPHGSDPAGPAGPVTPQERTSQGNER